MLTCHLMHGIFTEHVAKDILGGLMWAAAAMELSIYTLFSGIEFFSTRDANFIWREIPWLRYLLVSATIATGRGLTWVAYGATTYPTVLLFKSSKIIVVMFSAMVILRKRFILEEYAAALLAVVGLYLFSRGNKLGVVDVADGADTTSGVAVLFCAVAAEALTSTMQEICLRGLQRPLAELMFVTNGIGAVLLIAKSVHHGDALELHERLSQSWDLILWVLATVSLAYGGTYAFTSCIMGFGAVVATGLGIIRKLLSVLLSFVLFPKPFGIAHFLGLLAFFSGLLVAWSADLRKTQQRLVAQPRERVAVGWESSDEESTDKPRKCRTSPRLAEMQMIKDAADAKSNPNLHGKSGGGRVAQHDGLPSGPQA